MCLPLCSRGRKPVIPRYVKLSLLVLLALAAGAHFAVAAEAPVDAVPINVKGERITLVEGTLSADGRYAAGWTVIPKKGQRPVDWSKRDKEDSRFYEDYIENKGYSVVDMIVDLPRRAIGATLAFTDPYFGGKNHGDLHAVFGPERDGHRYALALSAGKWEPRDVVLLDLAADGATQSDVRKVLDEAVAKYIRTQRNPKGYTTDYMIYRLPEIGLVTGFSDATTVRVPFVSTIPKDEVSPSFNGTVQLRLSMEKGRPHAEAGEVRATGDEPDPVTDDPRVVAADKELNAAYTALRARLDAAGKTRLQTEQRAWIKERNDRIIEATNEGSDKPLANNPRFAADRLLLRLTTERTAALRAR